jgi:hypothetical protein
MYMYRKTVAIVIKSRSTSKVMDRAGNLSAELPQGIRERAAQHFQATSFSLPQHPTITSKCTTWETVKPYNT